MADSKRQIIKANMLDTLEAVAQIATVTDKFTRFAESESSNYPLLMLISNIEDREPVNSQKDTECSWMLDVWCYLKGTDDLETWIERVRAKIMLDRSRGTTAGVPNALDTFITQIITVDDNGLLAPGSFFLLKVLITYRVRE
jgi:hypothetical protein